MLRTARYFTVGTGHLPVLDTCLYRVLQVVQDIYMPMVKPCDTVKVLRHGAHHLLSCLSWCVYRSALQKESALVAYPPHCTASHTSHIAQVMMHSVNKCNPESEQQGGGGGGVGWGWWWCCYVCSVTKSACRMKCEPRTCTTHVHLLTARLMTVLLTSGYTNCEAKACRSILGVRLTYVLRDFIQYFQQNCSEV